MAHRGVGSLDPGGLLSELPGFLLSLMALLALVFLAQIFSDQHREDTDALT